MRLINETVWLTQQQMADLFQTTKQNISFHLINIYAEGELDELATVKDFLTVQMEDKRGLFRPKQELCLEFEWLADGFCVFASIPKALPLG